VIRAVRVRSTKRVEQIWVSEALLEDARLVGTLEILGEPRPIVFDESGNLSW